MSVCTLLLLLCVHSLELGLDLGNSLDRREEENACTLAAYTRIAELPKIKRRLILNDTRIFVLGLTICLPEKVHGKESKMIKVWVSI